MRLAATPSLLWRGGTPVLAQTISRREVGGRHRSCDVKTAQIPGP